MIWGIRAEGASRFAEYVGSIEEWRLEHGFKLGLGHGVGSPSPGPVNCRHHPSIGFARDGAVWSQAAQGWAWSLPCLLPRDRATRAIPKPVLAHPCCAADLVGQGKGVVKMGWVWHWPNGSVAQPWWVSSPLWLRIYFRWGNSSLQQDIWACRPGWVTASRVA